MQAPGRAKFGNVNGYFEQPVASFDKFAQRLVPSHCLCDSSEPMLCSIQCQAALKILGLTDEHKRMIDDEMERFQRAGPQMLRNYFKSPMKAEIKLQGVLNNYFNALSCIASNAHPSYRKYQAELEPNVGYTPHHSDIAVSYGADEKLCILVELKYSGVKSRDEGGFQKAFSQLMHAAALALNAKQWDKQLCCCLGSLTHWHVFLLKVVRDPDRDCSSFRISHYNMFALQNCQFNRKSTLEHFRNCWPKVDDLYRELLKHFLLWLLAERFTPSYLSITD